MASTVWTDKHQAFCYQHKLPPSAQALWQWLLMHQKPDKPDIEFNLQAFNKHVTSSRGRPYDPKTLKRAAAALVQSGAIIDEGSERFQWNWKRWILRSIKLLVDKIRPRKKCPVVDTNAEKQASNPQSVEEEELQQQHLQSILLVCQRYGFSFDPNSNAFKEVLTHSLEEITLALEYVCTKATKKEVPNPEGYVLEALRQKWYVPRRSLFMVPEFIYHPNLKRPWEEDTS